MKRTSADLLKLAKAVARTELTFLRSPQAEDNTLNVIHYEVSRFVNTVRKNEGLSTFVNRRDDKDAMRLEIGVSDHEASDAIVDAIMGLAERLANRNDVEMG